MDRVMLGLVFLAVACRSSEPTRDPEDIEARANEVKARLLTECQAGDDSACRRLGVSEPEAQREASPTADAPEASGGQRAALTPRALELDSWPGGATGLFLGSTPAETAADCSRLGGTAIMLRSDQSPVAHPEDIDDGGTIMCLGRWKFDMLRRGGPLDAFLLLANESAMVNFCLFESNLTACELHLDTSDNTHHFAVELLRKIEDQYGPIDPSNADFNCRMDSDRELAFRGTWSWETTTLDDSGTPFPVGSLLLNYGCTPIVERPEVFLVLRDTVGMLRATGHLQGGRIVR